MNIFKKIIITFFVITSTRAFYAMNPDDEVALFAPKSPVPKSPGVLLSPKTTSSTLSNPSPVTKKSPISFFIARSQSTNPKEHDSIDQEIRQIINHLFTQTPQPTKYPRKKEREKAIQLMHEIKAYQLILKFSKDHHIHDYHENLKKQLTQRQFLTRPIIASLFSIAQKEEGPYAAQLIEKNFESLTPESSRTEKRFLLRKARKTAYVLMEEKCALKNQIATLNSTEKQGLIDLTSNLEHKLARVENELHALEMLYHIKTNHQLILKTGHRVNRPKTKRFASASSQTEAQPSKKALINVLL